MKGTVWVGSPTDKMDTARAVFAEVGIQVVTEDAGFLRFATTKTANV